MLVASRRTAKLADIDGIPKSFSLVASFDGNPCIFSQNMIKAVSSNSRSFNEFKAKAKKAKSEMKKQIFKNSNVEATGKVGWQIGI